MKVSRSAQTCALGAAIFGAVVGGVYSRVEQAQKRMTGVKSLVYRPIKANAAVYAELYFHYRQLHDAFGTTAATDQLHGIMKRLIAIRSRVRQD